VSQSSIQIYGQVWVLQPQTLLRDVVFHDATLLAEPPLGARFQNVTLSACRCFYNGFEVSASEWLRLIQSEARMERKSK
jgi:hypothetical protein